MKTLLLALAALSAGATTITSTAPVSISGGGSFTWDNHDPMDGGWEFYLSGSNGVDSVFVNCITTIGWPVNSNATSIALGAPSGRWNINGAGGVGMIELTIREDGTGHLDTAAGQITGSIDLLGYFQITSIDRGTPLTYSRGTFIISPTAVPEQSSGWLFGTGLLGLYFVVLYSHRARYIRNEHAVNL